MGKDSSKGVRGGYCPWCGYTHDTKRTCPHHDEVPYFISEKKAQQRGVI